MKPFPAQDNILVIDASTAQAVIGLFQGGKCLAEQSWQSTRGNPGNLVAALQGLLQTTGLTWDAIDTVIVGCGPGQYAGLRVSVTVAQSLQLPSHGIVTGICSAYAIGSTVAAQNPSRSILVCGDARRNHVWHYHWNTTEISEQTPQMQYIPTAAFANVAIAPDCVIASPDYTRLQASLQLPPGASWVEGDCHPTSAGIYQAACNCPAALAAPDILYVHPPVAMPPQQGSPA